MHVLSVEIESLGGDLGGSAPEAGGVPELTALRQALIHIGLAAVVFAGQSVQGLQDPVDGVDPIVDRI